MTDTEAELLPCPFCGGKAQMYATTSMVPDIEPPMYVVACDELNCCDTRPQHTRGEAAAFWNNRPTPSKER